MARMSSARTNELPVLQLVDDELTRGPWIYARSVRGLAPGSPVPAHEGALVEVVDASNRFIGHALHNLASDIRLRFVSRGKRSALEQPRVFLQGKLAAADRLRRRALRLPDVTDAYRICHAEGDDLSGLVVDRLGSALVCEYHALGFWRWRAEIEWALLQLYPDAQVVHRVPDSARRQEGFPESEPLDGPPAEELVIRENGLLYPVRPGGGHKTGWFCDQRDNRVRIGALARGRDVLDLCCNGGGFALHAARAGAQRVRAVDLDEQALDRAARAATLNELTIEPIHADAFDVLRGLAQQRERPELIVLDPHKLIPSKAHYEAGLRRYADFNTLALSLVRPGGLVATFSCSGSLELAAFFGMLFGAARRAGREIRLLETLEAGPDHPQRPDFPRSRYLKGALLAVD